MRMLLMATGLLGLFIANALAAPPPPAAKPLSELLQTVERHPGFHYIDEVDWEHGVYEVEYYTRSGAKVEVCLDPVSGKTVRCR